MVELGSTVQFTFETEPEYPQKSQYVPIDFGIDAIEAVEGCRKVSVQATAGASINKYVASCESVLYFPIRTQYRILPSAKTVGKATLNLSVV